MRVARRDARAELADEREAGHWIDPAQGDVLLEDGLDAAELGSELTPEDADKIMDGEFVDDETQDGGLTTEDADEIMDEELADDEELEAELDAGLDPGQLDDAPERSDQPVDHR